MTITDDQPVSAANLKAFADNMKSGGGGVPETLLATDTKKVSNLFYWPFPVDGYSRFYLMAYGNDNYDSSNVYTGYIDAAIGAKATLKATKGNYEETVVLYAADAREGGFRLEIDNMSTLGFFRIIGYLK